MYACVRVFICLLNQVPYYAYIYGHARPAHANHWVSLFFTHHDDQKLPTKPTPLFEESSWGSNPGC